MQNVCWHGSTLCDDVRGSRHTEHSSRKSSVSALVIDDEDSPGGPGDSVDIVRGGLCYRDRKWALSGGIINENL